MTGKSQATGAGPAGGWGAAPHPGSSAGSIGSVYLLHEGLPEIAGIRGWAPSYRKAHWKKSW